MMLSLRDFGSARLQSSSRSVCATPARQGRVVAPVAPGSRRARLLVLASKEDGPEKQKDTGSDAGKGGLIKNPEFDSLLERLKDKGMTPAKARETLQVWAELGARDPQELKKLLVQRSMQPMNGLIIQCALDTVASLGGFFTGGLVGQSGNFPGQLLLQLVAYFFGCYYFIQAGLEAYALISIASAAKRYSTDSEALLAAVQQLAGPGTGFGVVNKVALAVSTTRVLEVLDAISEVMNEMSRDGTLPRSTLSNLSAYLTVQRAQQQYGFSPAKYDLTEEQATEIAVTFSEFDSNGDGQFDAFELRALCARLGKELSDEEGKEAVRLLDAGKTGFVQFSDFVEWFLKGAPKGKGAPEAAGAKK